MHYSGIVDRILTEICNLSFSKLLLVLFTVIILMYVTKLSIYIHVNEIEKACNLIWLVHKVIITLYILLTAKLTDVNVLGFIAYL